MNVDVNMVTIVDSADLWIMKIRKEDMKKNKN